ncbi:MAG TPA: biopolymer transporter ExbD [Anaerohalosphaeraceae bacterium]|nr:biopolymer transporter ExbD [Anaerohalosphaeraceae bacterium]
MRKGFLNLPFEPTGSFDMTPIIDVVFLLIIFFMLVFQFITAEKADVQVPESIRSAQPSEEDVLATVTVGRDSEGKVFFRVDGVSAEVSEVKEVSSVIADLIDRQAARKNGSSKKIVRLRCDKEIPFGIAKYALQGIADSRATDIQWSVIKGN